MEKLPGKLIAFEGPPGSGKTTQAEMLKHHLHEAVIKVDVDTEPTECSVFGNIARAILSGDRGETDLAIRMFLGSSFLLGLKDGLEPVQLDYFKIFEKFANELLRGNNDNLAMLLQYCLIFDHLFHLDSIAQRRQSGTVVICDQFVFHILALGAASGSLRWRDLWKIQKEIIGDKLIFPDLMFVSIMEPEVCLARAALKLTGRQKLSERFNFVKKICGAYEEIIDSLYLGSFEPFRVVIIRPLLLSPQSVWNDVHGHVKKILDSACCP